jgi:site-specific DNA-methyltransferase (adenine-specific)
VTPHYADELATLYLGDCVEVMAELPAESVDAIVTDPPYGLEFMGKEWDRLWNEGEDGRQGRIDEHGGMDMWGKRPQQAWHEAWAREALRVAKPGAHLLAFGGSRTHHRLASAIEDAGWEIRDCLVWAYASGFPKSLDVSKAIDKAAGAERESTGPVVYAGGHVQNHAGGRQGYHEWKGEGVHEGTEPATDAARQWAGWGTALKPAWEPIVLARKPLRGTVAGNVQEYGTGALNIGATRIGVGDGGNRDGEASASTRYGGNGIGFQPTPGVRGGDAAGRWPANLLLTDPIFDGDTPGVVGGGEAVSFAGRGPNAEAYKQAGTFFSARGGEQGYGDSGTYSRFFLVPKSSRSDREPATIDEALRLHRERGECDKLPAWRRQDLSPSEPTDSLSLARDTSDEPSTGDSNSATSLPGKPPTARSPRATRSTTSTATRPTTGSPTSSSSIPSATSASIPAASSETGNGGSPAASAEPSSLWAPEIGTSPPKGGRSTGGVGPATSARWSSRNSCGDCGKPLPRVSTHPTQKPTALMRHLVRLVTPPGGTVLDCFLGSGTTAIAANQEGFRAIGIEREPEYLDIAVARLAHQPLGMAL